jgi:hypothetical protein
MSDALDTFLAELRVALKVRTLQLYGFLVGCMERLGISDDPPPANAAIMRAKRRLQ